MTAGCETKLADGRMCDVPAVGRCGTCNRAFCKTHQAREDNNYGGKVYIEWCAGCQKAKAAAEAEKQARVHQKIREKREAAAARMSYLLEEFRRRPFNGQPRQWTSSINKGPGFFSTANRYKITRHEDEPAIPIGKLEWWYFSYLDGGGECSHTYHFDTGLTRSAEFVLMDAEVLHRSDPPHGLRLAPNQEEKICAALERLLHP